MTHKTNIYKQIGPLQYQSQVRLGPVFSIVFINCTLKLLPLMSKYYMFHEDRCTSGDGRRVGQGAEQRGLRCGEGDHGGQEGVPRLGGAELCREG